MRLRPVDSTPEPEYPEYGKFHQDRRAFLRGLGAVAGALLAGNFLPGCGKGEAKPAGELPWPQPPAPPPDPRGTRPDPATFPESRTGGRVVAPKPPDPGVAGGMDGPDPPDPIAFPEDGDEERLKTPPPPPPEERPR